MKKLLLFASAVALLASCSQDLTEDFAPAKVAGKSTVIATYATGDGATRTVATPNTATNGYNFTWEAGDALGVFNYAEEGDNANSYFGYASATSTTAAKFTGDLAFLQDGKYVGYYPYAAGREISEDGELTLSIPATQNYRFNVASGSFAANVNPAAAYGEATEDGELALTFCPMGAYLIVPVEGYGKVKSIELKISDKSSVEQVLAGDYSIDIASLAEANGESSEVDYEFNKDSKSDVKTITLNCGKGVDLTPGEAKKFWFVIPAGINMASFTLTVNGEDEQLEYELKTAAGEATSVDVAPNTPYEVSTPFHWVEGDAYVITNESEFLQYAYAATNGVKGAPEAMVTGDDNDELRPAAIVKNLDFKTFYDELNVLWSQAIGKYDGYEKTVLEAYMKAEGYIPTIGAGDDATVYSIKGNVDNGKAAEIKGLKVNGSKQNGIFARNEDIKDSSVENITLTGVEVKTKELPAIFLTSNPGTGFFSAFKNITVDGGSMTIEGVEGNVKGAVLENVYLSNLAGYGIKVEEYPTNTVYANLLLVDTTAELGSDYFTEDGAMFNQVRATTTVGNIVTVESAAAAGKLVDIVDVKNSAANWFSVVTRKAAVAPATVGDVETSYWTGLVADKDNADAVYTAEELAYAVKADVEGNTATLTNDIDLMNKDWSANMPTDYNNAKQWLTVNSKQPADAKKDDAPKAFTISNAVLSPAENDTNTYLFGTLFGNYAIVENVKVNGIEINGAKFPYASGLAMLGTAKNVEVEGVKITNADKLTGVDGYIGGMFLRTSSVESVTAVDVTVTGAKVPVGNVAGVLYLYDDKVSTFEFDDINVGAANEAFGEVSMVAPDDEQQTYTTIVFTHFIGVAPNEDNIYLDADANVESHAVKLYVGEEDTKGTMFTIGKKDAK